jgi:large subunit ribosomal protein L47
MARIKYVLNERRLALVAAAESSRPTSHPAIRVHARSPLGTADPLSLTGFEEIEYTAEEKALLADEVNGDEEGLSGGFGDGERQKMDLNVGKEGKAVAEKAEVSQAEVESRDEGFGGGSEAKEFVKTMNERQA